MSLRRFTAKFALIFFVLTIPATSFGASPSIVPGDDGATVSRGDFLHAAVISLTIPFSPKSAPQGTYARPIPKALQPYVNAAEKQNALQIFGNDLALGKSITRGEAVTLMALLMNEQPSGSKLAFTDVKAGSLMERGVRVAIERGWMQPVKPTFFGVDRVLTVKEARLILNKGAGYPDNTEIGPVGQVKIPSTTIKIKTVDTPALPQNALLQTVWQLLNQQYYYTDKINATEAGYKAAEAIVNSLGDPYTVFMRPADAQQFQSQIDGQVSGIGAQVEYNNNALTVVAPISGSPAEKAGLKSGDQITEVDGVSLAGSNLVDAVNKIRGPKGTSVRLTVIRNGSTMEIDVTRDTVTLPEIDISSQDNVAIVRLVQFGQTTDTQLRSLMADVASKNPKGIILDLRNNPGGLLHAAEETLSNFLPEGSTAAIIHSRGETFNEVTSEKPTIDASIPMVVLINKGSASASEIVAGALQDDKRATVVGETSFGKGTVQQIIEFKDGSSLKMTIAQWNTPKDRSINHTGLTPDVVVPTGDGTRDDQLLKALDLLR